jgi:hypothetical protein
VNLADIVLGLALGAIVIGGLWRGLSGLVLITTATLLSLIAAGIAAFLTVGLEEVPAGWLFLLVPGAFFITLFLTGYFLRSIATHLTRFIHRLPFASIDRLLGAALAGGLGILVLSLLILGILSVPYDNPVTREVESGETTPILLSAGAETVGLLARPLPFLTPLLERLEAVSEDLVERRASAAPGPARIAGMHPAPRRPAAHEP